MNFLLGETTFLKYFIPLTIEGNIRGIRSKYFLGHKGKPTDPQRNKAEIIKLSKIYNFDVYDLSQINNSNGIIFCIEGVDIDVVNNDRKIIVITYMSDYTNLYSTYINKVTNIIFPSKTFAIKYNKLSDKNLYLGSPKYDHLNKIKLDNKSVLIMYPKNRDLNKIDLGKIYNWLREMGYHIIVKSRPKDPIRNEFCGDESYVDHYWYPSISLELMQRSSLVINFGSTSIKEIVMMRKPVINFDVKPYNMQLDFLYEGDYCKQMKTNCNREEFTDAIKNIGCGFQTIIDKHLFELGSCKRILDYITN